MSKQQSSMWRDLFEPGWREREAERPKPDDRPCTCHPDDSPPQPCAKRYALAECKAAHAAVA